VRVLAEGTYSAGFHVLRWDGRDESGADVASGTYFCCLDTAGAALKGKLVLIR
jgi:flagellar hook assembly protein FlgD